MKKLKLNGYIGDEINSSIVADFLNDANGEDIEVSLYSGGGDVFEGFEIYNQFAAYEGSKTLNLGSLVASAATYMPMAFDNVVALDTTNFMIHSVTSWVMGGTANELKAEAERTEKLQNLIAAKYAEVMNKTPEEVNALMEAETWFTGQEIVDAGFATDLKKTGKANKSINYYKNQVKTYFNKIVHKEEEEEKVMDKKELLNALIKEGVKLDEVATALKAENRLKTDEDSRIEKLEKENEMLKMSNELNKVFGLDGLPRTLAENYAKAGMSIDDMKKDEVMINLMAKKAEGEKPEELHGKKEDKKKATFKAEEY